MLAGSEIKSKEIEIIPNKLYWLSASQAPKNGSKTFFFNIDNDLVYEPFFSDFGPLDIGKTVRFVKEVEKLLECPKFTSCKIYHHTSLDLAKRSNAAFLMGAFQVIILHKTAEEAWEPFKKVYPSLVPFRDASAAETCEYKCTILDCLKGVEQAIKLGWFNIKEFDLKSYEHYGKMENGDMNWIIPGKILAFSGPSNTSKDADGFKRFVPEDYVAVFKKMGIKTVIRLGSKQYDENRFKKCGLKHFDLDISSCLPSDEVISKFIAICGETKGGIAVHCEDGHYKTGLMIAYLSITKHSFCAASFIGWIRLCRPGSILGKQHEFLLNHKKNCNFRSLILESIGHDISTISQSVESFIFNETDIHGQVCQQPYISKPPKSNISQISNNIKITPV